MQPAEWFTQLARIALPCILAVLLQLSPVPKAVSEGLQDGYTAEKNGNLPLAAQNYSRAAKIQPWREGLLEKSGMLYYRNNDFENAALSLQAAQDNGDLSAQGQKTLGDVYFQRQHFDQALQVWTKLVSGNKVDERVFLDIIEKMDSSGFTAEQAILYREWTKQYPENAQACFQLGLIQIVDNPAEAVTRLSMAKSLSPSLAEQADTLLDVLASLQGSDERYRLVMAGRTLGNLGEWGIANYAFQKAVELDPEYGDAWAFLAESKQQLGLPALDEVEKANHFSPDSIGVKIFSALYWRRQNQPDKALAIMQEIADLQPGEYIWLIEMGNITAQGGDFDEAYEYFRRAIEAEPDNAQWLKELIAFCLQNSYEVRTIAMPAARKYLKLDHESSESLAMMGRVMLELQDTISAERYLLRSLEKDGTNTAAHLYLGQTYLMEAQQAQAYDQLMIAQTQSSAQPEAARLAQRLLEQYFPKGAPNTP